jgi:hypothetical protein
MEVMTTMKIFAWRARIATASKELMLLDMIRKPTN